MFATFFCLDAKVRDGSVTPFHLFSHKYPGLFYLNSLYKNSYELGVMSHE
jgi:hypothetical protein